jgi:hypothetical protein
MRKKSVFEDPPWFCSKKPILEKKRDHVGVECRTKPHPVYVFPCRLRSVTLTDPTYRGLKDAEDAISAILLTCVTLTDPTYRGLKVEVARQRSDDFGGVTLRDPKGT